MTTGSPTHGPWCGANTTPPFPCKFCGTQIFFFSCVEHRSRVLFEQLGHPWPVHDCEQRRAAAPRRSGRWMLAGTIDNGYAESIRRNLANSRGTIRVEPTAGESVTLEGVVDHVENISALDRLRWAPGTFGANQIVNRFGTEFVTQITLRIDDSGRDPSAHDFLSYTFWASTSDAHEAERGDVLSVTLAADMFLSAAGVPWLAQRLEFVL